MKAEVEDSSLLQEVISSRPDNTPFIIKLGDIDDLTKVEIPSNKKIMLKADREVTLKCLSKSNDYKHFHVQNNASLTLEGQITLQGTDYGSSSQYALYVARLGKAEIKDGVTITGFKNADRGTVFVDGELTMTGGTITGNKANKGGGVYVDANGMYNIYGIFTMTGGNIEGNTADTSGGEVYIVGTFTMSGGIITKNKANIEGKAVMLEHDFWWNSGEIKDNEGSVSAVGGSSYYFHNGSGNTAS